MSLDSLEFMHEVQWCLDYGTSTPVVALAGAPIQAAISVIQAVGGLVGAVVCGVIGEATNNEWMNQAAFNAQQHMSMGLGRTCKAVANFFLLGFPGYFGWKAQQKQYNAYDAMLAARHGAQPVNAEAEGDAAWNAALKKDSPALANRNAGQQEGKASRKAAEDADNKEWEAHCRDYA